MADPVIAPVWLDGQLVAGHQAHIALSDRGFLLGDGVFETMLWMGGPGPTGVALFDAHMARLSHAASALGLMPDVDEGQVRRAVQAVCSGAARPMAVRLSLSRGQGPRGLAIPKDLHPRMAVTASAWATPGPLANLVRTPVARAPGAPSARFKTLSYIDNVEALRQAQEAGGDDGLMIGRSGFPVCASAASLVVRIGDTLLTPPVHDGALPGIIRGLLVSAGLVHEAPISWEQIAAADGIALTNALVGVRPVVAFEGRLMPTPFNWLKPLIAHVEQARSRSLPGPF